MKTLYFDKSKSIVEYYIRSGENVEIQAGKILKIDSGTGYIENDTDQKYSKGQVIRTGDTTLLYAYENTIMEEISI